MALVKNPTAWRPPSGQGSIITIGNLPIVSNAFLPLVDNTTHHYPIVTNPTYNLPKARTSWTNNDIKSHTKWSNNDTKNPTNWTQVG